MSEKLKLHGAYYPHRIAVPVDIGGPSLTRQEFHDECDINTLVARYEKSGVLPGSNVEPRYFDCTVIPTDFRAILDFMRQANESFMSLPAKVRREFDNDASAFVDFASDPANGEKLREWGLCDPAAAPAPIIKVEVVSGAPIVAPTGEAPKPDKP